MAAACIHISVHVRISDGARYESIRTVRTIPYANMADVDAICCIWCSDCKDECEGTKMVPDSIGDRSGGLFGVELV